MRIMAHTDGIAAHFFELFKAAYPDFFCNGGTECTGIVVNADPLISWDFIAERIHNRHQKRKVRIPTRNLSAKKRRSHPWLCGAMFRVYIKDGCFGDHSVGCATVPSVFSFAVSPGRRVALCSAKNTVFPF